MSFNERTIEYAYVFDAINKHAPRTFLDVGTGKTALPALVKACGIEVFAIDRDESQIAQNDMVVAARVDLGDLPIPMKIPGLPHITIATNPESGGKPHMSNDFVEEDFQPISSFEVCGAVEEVFR